MFEKTYNQLDYLNHTYAYKMGRILDNLLDSKMDDALVEFQKWLYSNKDNYCNIFHLDMVHILAEDQYIEKD